MSDLHDFTTYYLAPLAATIFFICMFTVIFTAIYFDNKEACELLDNTAFDHEFEWGECYIIYNGIQISVDKQDAFKYI